MTALIDIRSKKNPKLTYLFYAIITIALLLLQTTFLRFLTIANITPDFLIILCVIIALREGMLPALFASFIIGLTFDIITLDVLGTNALTKTIVAFIAGWFYKEDHFQNIISSIKFFGIVLLSCFVHNLIYYFLYIKQSEMYFPLFFLKYGVASTIYTSIFALFFMLTRFSAKKRQIV